MKKAYRAMLCVLASLTLCTLPAHAAAPIPIAGGIMDDALSGAAIGLIAVGAYGAYLWFKKRKEQTSDTVYDDQSYTDTTSFSAPTALMGQSGPMNGCRFPLQGGSLCVGRDSSCCAIIFPNGTPGVSAVHCQLICQDGAWVLMDMGSTYGTFLNGEKLAPSTPYPLNPGDRFWLGQADNSFAVEGD